MVGLLTTAHAFERKIGAAVSSARSRAQKYGEDAAELISRFGAKSQPQSPALPELEVGDA